MTELTIIQKMQSDCPIHNDLPFVILYFMVIFVIIVLIGINLSGQVVLPHYKNIFSGISKSYVAASAYGLLTGKR